MFQQCLRLFRIPNRKLHPILAKTRPNKASRTSTSLNSEIKPQNNKRASATSSTSCSISEPISGFSPLFSHRGTHHSLFGDAVRTRFSSPSGPLLASFALSIFLLTSPLHQRGLTACDEIADSGLCTQHVIYPRATLRCVVGRKVPALSVYNIRTKLPVPGRWSSYKPR
jgi:hypothetical protein